MIRCEHERDLDAVTGVSGSGPAYVFYFLEALEQAAKELGPCGGRCARARLRDVRGQRRSSRSRAPEPPATLRANVTSKGGTTARALDVLDAAQVNLHFIAAVKAAAARARELGDEIAR